MANKTIPAIQTNEGNVGIGTTAPAYKLDVTNSITSRSAFNSPRFSSAGTYVYGVTNSPTWVIGNGSSTNNNATAPDGTTSAGTYTLSATSALQFDLYLTISGLTNGRVYTVGMWVKLGTATNFCLVVNNTGAWNTIGGKAFTSSDGLSTSKWTHISYTFAATASGAINLHLGYHLETGVTQQTAGTVFLWNIEMTEFSSTWIGNVEDEIRLPGSSIWTSRGNVGIGTNNPSAKLEVAGSLRVTGVGQIGPAGGYGIALFNDQTNNFIGQLYGRANGIQFTDILGNATVYIASGGNVGIGEQSPVAKLQVTSNLEAAVFKGTATFGSAIQIEASSAGGRLYQIQSTANGAGEGGGRLLLVDKTAAATRLTIKSDGTVGIGTTNPTKKLQVAGGLYWNLNDTNADEHVVAIARSVAAAAGSFTEIGSLAASANSIRATIEIFHHDCSTIEYSMFELIANYYTGATTDWVQLPSRTQAHYAGEPNGVVVDARLATTGGAVDLRFRSLGGACAAMAVFARIKANTVLTETTATGTGATVAGLLGFNRYEFPVTNDRFKGTYDGLFIKNNGFIGIGSTNPQSKLSISGTTAAIALSFGNTVANNPLILSTYSGWAGIGMDQSTAGLRLVGDYSSTTTPLVDVGSYIGGAVSHANWKSSLKVLNNSQVSIGGVTPLSLLAIGGSGSTTAASGITFGNDAQANLYRAGEDTIKTDGSLNVAGLIYNANSAYYSSLSKSTNANWGQYTVVLGNASYSSQLIQVSVNGGNLVWAGTFLASCHLSYRPNETWINVKLLECATYNCGNDDVTLLALSNSNTSQYGVPALVLKTNGAINGGYGTGTANNIVVTVNGASPNEFVLSSSSWTQPYTYQIATSANTKQIFTNEAGRVGIGTAFPVQKFQIDGTVGNPASIAATQSGIFRISNTTDNAVLDFGIRAAGNGAWIQSTDETALNFNYPLLLNPNGANVGIGTTIPSGGLHVNNAVGSFSEVLRLQRNGGVFYSVGLDTNFLNIAYNGNVNANNVLVLTNGGYLGVGNLQNALFNLDIASTQGKGIQLRFDTGTGYRAQITPYWNTTTDTRIDFAINRSANLVADVIMSVGYDNNVGIGTTAPGAKLDVVGTIRPSSNILSHKTASYTTSYPGINSFGADATDSNITYYDTGKLVANVQFRGVVWTGKHYIFTDQANNRAYFYDNNFTQITNAYGYYFVTLPLPSGYSQPHGAAWDGRYLWLIVYAGGNLKIVGYDLDSSTQTATIIAESAALPLNSTYDVEYADGHLYFIRAGTLYIYKWNGSSIDYVAAYAGAAGTINAQAITYDGSYLWVTENGANIYKVGLDGTPLATITSGFPPNTCGWAWNGSNIVSFDYANRNIFIINTTRLRIDTQNLALMGGKVGIGVTNPIEKLTVIGNVQLSGSNTNLNFNTNNAGNGNISFDGSTFTFVSNSNSAPIVLSTSSFERVRITNVGRVGIGTNSPTTLLSVGGLGSTTAASGITFGGDAQANLYRAGEDIIKTDATLQVGGNFDGFGTVQAIGSILHRSTIRVLNKAATDWVTWFTRDTSESETIGRLDNIRSINGSVAGNLGIGTTLPSGKLHVVSSVSNDTLLRADGTNGTLFSVVDDLSDSLMSVNNSAGLPVLEVFANDRVVMGQYGANDFVLINNKIGLGTSNPANKLTVIGGASIGSTTYNTSAPSNGLLVEGNVGIGTTLVGNPLEVYGTSMDPSLTPSAASIFNVNSLGVELAVGRMVTSPFSLWLQGKHATVGGSLTYPIVLNPLGGNVGIGLTNPSTKLEVGYFLDAFTNKITVSCRYENQPEFNFKLGQAGTNFDWIGGVISCGDDGNYNGIINFKTANAGRDTPTTKMVIRANGNVGINITTPTSKLHVVETTPTGSRIQLGSISTSSLMNAGLVNDFLILTAPFNGVPASTSNNNAKWGIKMGGGSVDSPNALEKSACIYAVSEEDIGAGGAGAGYNRKVGLAFHTSPFDLPNVERVRINNLGYVGIGTTSPLTLLSVGAASSTSAANGITFGGDAQANIYRSSEDNLATDGNFNAAGNVNSKNSRATNYTSIASGSSGNWFPIFTVSDTIDAVVICNIKTFAHGSLSFIAARGYGPSQTHAITILSAQLNANGGYANISGVRIRESGTVEIQLSWSSGPAVDISIQIIGTSYTPTFAANLTATSASDTIVDSVSSVLSQGMVRTKTAFAAGSNILLNQGGASYINGGFVGIGTATAVGRLDVYDDTNAGHISFVRNANTGSAAYTAIVLRRNGGNNGLVMFTNSSNRSTDGGLGNSTIRTDNGKLLLGAAGTTYHALETDGNVGIGLTNPVAARVHIKGDGSNPVLRVETADLQSAAGGTAGKTFVGWLPIMTGALSPADKVFIPLYK